MARPTLLQSGIVPLTDLAAWHALDDSVTGDVVYDYSGNARNLEATGDVPALTANVKNGKPGLYFDGTTADPINVSASITPVHFFIVASYDDSTFSTYNGLLSDITAGQTILTGNNTGTSKFFDFSFSDFTYKKNTVSYIQSNQAAPMSGNVAIIEVVIGGGAPMDGIQIGQQVAFTTRKWKGYFFESLIYTSQLTETYRQRVLLYLNLKFGLNKTASVPLYFPSDDIAGINRNRFYEVPEDFERITDTFEYEDGSKDFNEVSDTAAKRWEYGYTGLTPQQAVIFDEFNKAARRANSFYFRDKYGATWGDVRIQNGGYERTHDAHKSWVMNVLYKLENFNGVYTFTPDDLPPETPTGLAAEATSESAITWTWDASTDLDGGSGVVEFDGGEPGTEIGGDIDGGDI